MPQSPRSARIWRDHAFGPRHDTSCHLEKQALGTEVGDYSFTHKADRLCRVWAKRASQIDLSDPMLGESLDLGDYVVWRS